MDNVINYFVSTNCDKDALVYVSDNLLHQRDIEDLARKVFEDGFIECCVIRDDEIQYYCISERLWIDTQEKADEVRKYINE